jgi:predicted amidohydrolase
MVPGNYRIGMAQILVEGGRPQENLDRAVGAVRQTAAQGCRLVVLPECLDLGWTDPSARQLGQSIPGPHTDRLAQAAREHKVHVAADLVERAGDRLYNAALLFGPGGEILLHHRKINELDIALDLYTVGDRLGVVETELGTVGLAICADNFGNSLAIGHVLARMGVQVLLSPSAWAVNAGHDNDREPYGRLWRDAYTELARLHDVAVIGVSNVGRITAGPWQGRKCIGCSLAVGPGGEILAQGPYGEDAEALVEVEVRPRPPVARGTDFAAALQKRGYRGRYRDGRASRPYRRLRVCEVVYEKAGASCGFPSAWP